MKMKQMLSVMLSILMLCSAVILPVRAAEIDESPAGAAASVRSGDTLTEGFYNYTVNDDDTVTITKYTGDEEEVTIPGTIDGKSVTSIGKEAFYKKTSLTSITIPEGVTSIEDSAFSNCTSLKNAALPDSLTNLGPRVFFHCPGLTGITIPDSVTSIGHRAFCYCSRLTDITLSNSLTIIDHETFRNCTSLKSITIPGSVTSIGASAFNECTNLTSVTIPDNSVTSIGNYAFYKCTSLTDITIPIGVTSIGKNAFEMCTNLTNVSLPDSLTDIGNSAFRQCINLISVDIPSGMTILDSALFDFCEGLTSVSLPDTLITINNNAFHSCTSLTSITIPRSVTSIGSSVFRECTSLTDVYYGGTEEDWENIEIGDLNPSLDAAAKHFVTPSDFAYKKSGDGTIQITKYNGDYPVVFIPSEIDGQQVNEIGASAFEENTVITTVFIPDTVNVIWTNAFNGCTDLQNVYIPDSVDKIANFSFNGCGALTNLKLPGKLRFIGCHSFDGCTGINELVIPQSVKYLGYAAFGNCSNLKDVTFYGLDCRVNSSAFIGCEDLQIHGSEESSVYYFARENSIHFESDSMMTYYESSVYKKDDLLAVDLFVEETYTVNNIEAAITSNVPVKYTLVGLQSFDSSDLSYVTVSNAEITEEKILSNDNRTTIKMKFLNKSIDSSKTKIATVFYKLTKDVNREDINISVRFTKAANDTASYSYMVAPLINKINIGEAKLQLEKSSYVYDGEEKTPAVVVRNGNTELIQNTDYRVSYLNNAKAGKADVVVQGMGDYTGVKFAKFNIIDPNNEDSDTQTDTQTDTVTDTGTETETETDTDTDTTTDTATDTDTDTEQPETVTYYFLAPDYYLTTNDSVGFYYWQPNEPASWPGIAMTPAPEVGKNVFKCELPNNTITQYVLFNAFVDPADTESQSAAHTTKSIELAADDEHENFYDMIYVLANDDEHITVNEVSGSFTGSGKWFSIDPESPEYYKNDKQYYGSYGFENSTDNTDTGTDKKTTDSDKDTTSELTTDFGKDTSSEKTTDSVKDTSSEKTTDSVKDTTTEKTTDSVKDTTSEKTTDSAKDTSSEKTTDSVKDTASEKTTDSVKDTSSEKTTDSVKDTASEKTTDSAKDTSSEKTTDSAKDTSSEKTTDSVKDTSTEKATDSVKDTESDITTDTTVDTASDTATDTALDTSADTDSDTSADTDSSRPYTDPHEFNYKLYGEDTYYISDYIGSNTIVTIPSEIDGKKIVAVMRKDRDANAQAADIEKIYVSEGITEIGKYAFAEYKKLNEIELPSGLTTIGANSFYNCQSLESIEIPEGVTSLGPSTFNACSNLISVTIPESVTKVGRQAFFNCTSLAEIIFNGTSEQWNNIEFEDGNDKLKNATITFKNGETTKIDSSTDTQTDTDTSNDTNTDTENVEYKPMARGDVDGDGKISAKDSMSIQRYVLHFKKFDENQLRAGDVDGDGKVTNKDAMNILRYTININIKYVLGEIV